MFRLIVFLLALFGWAGAYAAECKAGFYLKNGACAPCQDNVYGYVYCPGDDTRHDCPADTTDWAQCTGVSAPPYHKELVAWAPTAVDGVGVDYVPSAVEHCIVSQYFHPTGGVFMLQSHYTSLRQDYCGSSMGKLYFEADAGYYLAGYSWSSARPWYNGVKPCTNKPAAHAHYTGPGTPDQPVAGGRTDYNDCPWECDAGYGLHNGECVPLCTRGFSKLKTNTGVSVNVYSTKYSNPALNISAGDGTCYVSLAPGHVKDAVNITTFDGAIYHTTD